MKLEPRLNASLQVHAELYRQQKNSSNFKLRAGPLVVIQPDANEPVAAAEPMWKLSTFAGDLVENPCCFICFCQLTFKDSCADPKDWIYLAEEQLRDIVAAYKVPYQCLYPTWNTFIYKILKRIHNKNVLANIPVKFGSYAQQRKFQMYCGGFSSFSY